MYLREMIALLQIQCFAFLGHCLGRSFKLCMRISSYEQMAHCLSWWYHKGNTINIIFSLRSYTESINFVRFLKAELEQIDFQDCDMKVLRGGNYAFTDSVTNFWGVFLWDCSSEIFESLHEDNLLWTRYFLFLHHLGSTPFLYVFNDCFLSMGAENIVSPQIFYLYDM